MSKSADYLQGRREGITQMAQFAEANANQMIQDNKPIFDTMVDIVDFLKALRSIANKEGEAFDIKIESLDAKEIESRILTVLDHIYVAGDARATHENVATMLNILLEK
jgi:hypothetical protein